MSNYRSKAVRRIIAATAAAAVAVIVATGIASADQVDGAANGLRYYLRANGL